MSNLPSGNEPDIELFDYPPFAEYPYDVPTGDTHMTIAAGFKCKDGVIICADREVTTSSGKTLKGKIWHGQNKDMAVVVTGAGKFAHLESAAIKITQRVSRVSSIGKAEELVREVFDYVVKKEFFTKPGCPSPGYPFDLIVGISSKTTVEIIRMEQGVLKTGNSKELAGSGAHIADYFFGQYYHPPVVLIDGMTLGAYVIYMVKESGLGCGGSTDLWVLEKGTDPSPYNVRYLDQLFQSLRIPFRDLLFATANLGLTKGKFASEIDRICRLTKQYRTDSLEKWKRARRDLSQISLDKA